MFSLLRFNSILKRKPLEELWYFFHFSIAWVCVSYCTMGYKTSSHYDIVSLFSYVASLFILMENLFNDLCYIACGSIYAVFYSLWTILMPPSQLHPQWTYVMTLFREPHVCYLFPRNEVSLSIRRQTRSLNRNLISGKKISKLLRWIPCVPHESYISIIRIRFCWHFGTKKKT